MEEHCSTSMLPQVSELISGYSSVYNLNHIVYKNLEELGHWK